MVLTKRDIAKSIKTLIVMLQSLRDQQVRITLRNDTLVTGKISQVDGDMNIELTDATVEQDLFYHIQPNDVRKKAKLDVSTTSSMEHLLDTQVTTNEQDQDRQTFAQPKEGVNCKANLSERKDPNCDNRAHRDAPPPTADDLVDKSRLLQTSVDKDTTTTASTGANRQPAPMADVAADHSTAPAVQQSKRKNEQQQEEGEGQASAADAALDDLPSTTTNVYDYFIVKGSRVRHIDLPADCDMIASTKCEIERIRARRKQWTKRDIVRRQQSD